jgi:hypothetical protein
MTEVLPAGSLPLAILTLVMGIGIVALTQMEARKGPRIDVQSLRAACSGLLLVSLSGIQFGLILLDCVGWRVLGGITLLASVPAAMLMAFGAVTTMPERDVRLPRFGPWDDDTHIG